VSSTADFHADKENKIYEIFWYIIPTRCTSHRVCLNW